MKIPMHDGQVVEVFQGIGDHDDLVKLSACVTSSPKKIIHHSCPVHRFALRQIIEDVPMLHPGRNNRH